MGAADMAISTGSDTDSLLDQWPLYGPDVYNTARMERTPKPAPNWHRCLPTVSLIALLFIFISASTGVTFSVLAVIYNLRISGDIPGRILVFAAATSSIVYISLHLAAARTQFVISGTNGAAMWIYGSNFQTATLLLSRISLIAWTAALVVTSLLIARVGMSYNASLASKAIYLNLVISTIALLSSCTLSFCIESSRTPFKTAVISQNLFLQSNEDTQTGNDNDSFHISTSQRSSVDEALLVAPGEIGLALTSKSRPKKLLFLYKATTQLTEEKDEDQVEKSHAKPEYQIVNRDILAKQTSSEKDEKSKAEDRFQTTTKLKVGGVSESPKSKHQDEPPRDKMQRPESFDDGLKTNSRLSSRTTLAPHREGRSDDKDQAAKKSIPRGTNPRAGKPHRIVPMSPAVTRPASIVPPVPPVLSVSNTDTTPVPPIAVHIRQGPAPGVIKRKPPGGAAIKRKQVPRPTALSAPRDTEQKPDEGPKSEVSPKNKTQFATASLPAPSPRSLQPANGKIAQTGRQDIKKLKSFQFTVALAEEPATTPSRKSSVASTSSSATTQTLGEMAASLRGSTFVTDFAPATRIVTFANPLVTEPQITRTSMASVPGGVSRRPSSVAAVGSIPQSTTIEMQAGPGVIATPQEHLDGENDRARSSQSSAASKSTLPLKKNKPPTPLLSLLPADDRKAAQRPNRRPVHTFIVHERDSRTGLSRTARRVRKTTAAPSAAPSAATSVATSVATSASSLVYVRRRPATSYNFSRPLRAANFGIVASNNLVAGSSRDDRARARRQLLQMLPSQQKQPLALMTGPDWPQRSHHERSMSLDRSLCTADNKKSTFADDSEWEEEDDDEEEDKGEESDERGTDAYRRRVLSVRYRDGQRPRAGPGLGGNRDSSTSDRIEHRQSRPLSRPRPISPMTVLMERCQR